MSTDEIYDLVIVGGGPGGCTAGIYAQRAVMKAVLVEKGLHGGQLTLTEEVENYPGFMKIPGFELAQKMADHAASLGLETISGEVTAVEAGDAYHTVKLDNDEVLKAYAVILATGGASRKLNIPGEDQNYGKGVSYCAVCDGMFFKDQTVAVIGGGDTAVEEAIYLSKIAGKVYLIHRRDEFRAGRLLQKRVMENPKIEILWNTIPKAIMASIGGVEKVVLEDTKTAEQRNLPVNGVFIFIGYNPNNQVVPKEVKLNDEGYVLTDTKCETNIPGIFAIGDLIEKFSRQIVTATGDGCNAALGAALYVDNKKAEEEEKS
ncbi:MAG: thioredoxin-disulfide reductase [Desulfobacterales bacterium]|nr:thioredoxin-disulfide reductase [Desulfobacterales bacterium]